MTVTISLVSSEEDIEAVRQLCRDFVAWQLDEFPELRQEILTYFEPSRWEETLAALPRLHARPQGAILLAREAGTPLGCVMYSGLEDGSAEAKRLFVSTQARGKGVGGALVKAMLEHARADGYSVMVLDTARFLTAAQRLYHLAGFVDVQPPAGVPAPLRDVAIFMRKELQGSYSP